MWYHNNINKVIMANKLVFLFSLLLTWSGSTTAKDCKLERKFIEESNRVLFTHDEYGYNKLHLRDTVDGHEELFVACIDDHTIESVVCAPKTGRFMPSLPTSYCPVPKATVKTVATFKGITEYSVGYTIDAHTYLELYRTAYNKPAVSAVYTDYDGVTGNMITQRPSQVFTTDGIISGADAATFQMSSIFQRFIDLYGPKQSFVKDARTSIIERGHMAPSADFLFAHDMRATFKYLNVVPQFGSINRGNWKTIETWVRAIPVNRTRDEHIPYRVLTGGLNVLKLPHSTNAKNLVPLYLEAGNKNPVPESTYKIVEKLDTCTVFVTYNNIFSTTKPLAICTLVKCPLDIKLSDSLTMGYTYCCSAKDFQKKYLPNVDIC